MKEHWKQDVVAFVEHWTKEKCPAADNQADILLWLNTHFDEALANFEFDSFKQAADLTIKINNMLMPK